MPVFGNGTLLCNGRVTVDTRGNLHIKTQGFISIYPYDTNSTPETMNDYWTKRLFAGQKPGALFQIGLDHGDDRSVVVQVAALPRGSPSAPPSVLLRCAGVRR